MFTLSLEGLRPFSAQSQPGVLSFSGPTAQMISEGTGNVPRCDTCLCPVQARQSLPDAIPGTPKRLSGQPLENKAHILVLVLSGYCIAS